MNPEERDQFAEKLLNATLGRYSAAEPAPGLEERLLAKLATGHNPDVHPPNRDYALFNQGRQVHPQVVGPFH